MVNQRELLQASARTVFDAFPDNVVAAALSAAQIQGHTPHEAASALYASFSGKSSKERAVSLLRSSHAAALLAEQSSDPNLQLAARYIQQTVQLYHQQIDPAVAKSMRDAAKYNTDNLRRNDTDDATYQTIRAADERVFSPIIRVKRSVGRVATHAGVLKPSSKAAVVAGATIAALMAGAAAASANEVPSEDIPKPDHKSTIVTPYEGNPKDPTAAANITTLVEPGVAVTGVEVTLAPTKAPATTEENVMPTSVLESPSATTIIETDTTEPIVELFVPEAPIDTVHDGVEEADKGNNNSPTIEIINSRSNQDKGVVEQLIDDGDIKTIQSRLAPDEEGKVEGAEIIIEIDPSDLHQIKGTPRVDDTEPPATVIPPAPTTPPKVPANPDVPDVPDVPEVSTPTSPEVERDASFKRIVAVNTARNPKAIDPNVLSDILNSTADKYNHVAITREYILSLLSQESRLDPNIVNKTSGAQGIAQMMPATAGELGLADAFDPAAAIDASFRYNIKIYDMLAKKLPNKTTDELIKLTLAGYNAGPYRSDVQSGSIPQIGETIAYVKIITDHMKLIYDVEQADVDKANTETIVNENPAPNQADEIPKFSGEWLPAAPAGTPITSQFGYRGVDANGNPVLHDGIDFGGTINTPFFATAGGRIKLVTSADVTKQQFCIDALGGLGLGTDVVTDPFQKEVHVTMNIGTDTYTFIYAHLSSFNPELVDGGIVQAGQEVGKMGSSGCSTAVHGHFLVHKNGKPMNPMLLNDDPSWKALAETTPKEKPAQAIEHQEQSLDMGAKVVAFAKKFDDLGYLWGGGYDSGDPITGQKSGPIKDIVAIAKAGTNKGEHIVDCGGLLRASYLGALGADIGPLQFVKGEQTVTTPVFTADDGKKYQFTAVADKSKAQIGDVFVRPGHVGFITGASATPNTYDTFEAIDPNVKIEDNIRPNTVQWNNPADVAMIYRLAEVTTTTAGAIDEVLPAVENDISQADSTSSHEAGGEIIVGQANKDGLLQISHDVVAEPAAVESGNTAEGSKSAAESIDEAKAMIDVAKRVAAVVKKATEHAHSVQELAH